MSRGFYNGRCRDMTINININSIITIIIITISIIIIIIVIIMCIIMIICIIVIVIAIMLLLLSLLSLYICWALIALGVASQRRRAEDLDVLLHRCAVYFYLCCLHIHIYIYIYIYIYIHKLQLCLGVCIFLGYFFIICFLAPRVPRRGAGVRRPRRRARDPSAPA